MKKIFIVSDTHGYLPVTLEPKKVDAVIHAGDIGREILNEFYVFDSQYIVCGNTDFDIHETLPHTITDTIDGVRFFTVHNLSAPHRIIPANRDIIDRFQPQFVIFGHSHIPHLDTRDDILYCNPGSLGMGGMTDRRSYGILTVDNGSILSAEIFDLTGRTVFSWLHP